MKSVDMFYIKESPSSPVNQHHHCELRLKRPMDFEAVKQYTIVVRLKAVAPADLATGVTAHVDPDKSVTRVDLNVVDINDNSPRFLFKYPESKWANGQVFLTILKVK